MWPESKHTIFRHTHKKKTTSDYFSSNYHQIQWGLSLNLSTSIDWKSITKPCCENNIYNKHKNICVPNTFE